MKKKYGRLGCVFAVVLCAGIAAATPSSVLLEKGIYTEETVGDLDGAIDIYKQIVEDDQANRKYVAEALFRMGRCYAATDQTKVALEELQKLTAQFPEQEDLAARAKSMIAELTPKPLFPELENCRLKYPIELRLTTSWQKPKQQTITLYKTDLFDLTWKVDEALEDKIERFDISLVPKSGMSERDPIWLARDIPPNSRSLPTRNFDEIRAWKYVLKVEGYGRGKDIPPLITGEISIQLEPTTSTQINFCDIRSSESVQSILSIQMLNASGRELSTVDGLRNSDFVHVESMTDDEGLDLEFTSSHEKTWVNYVVNLNKPIPPGEITMLSLTTQMEGLIAKVPGKSGEYMHETTHMPGVGGPTHRVEVYRLPKGAELLETTPPDLPHRIRDGRVELLVDTIIPTGGRLLAGFRYRLAKDNAKIIVEDAALRLMAAIRDEEDDVLRELAFDRRAGWREAVPKIAAQCRVLFREFTGKPFNMRPSKTLVMGDIAVVKCIGDMPFDRCLVLFFEKTDDGWKNISMQGSPLSQTLESHFMAAAMFEICKAQIIPLKKLAGSEEKLKALEQIEAILANASFHHESLVKLAEMVIEAPHNHQRIVKAAQLASKFGYHTGGLTAIAKIAVAADRECEELDEILELVVLKLSETLRVVDLARSAVDAKNNNEKEVIRNSISEMRQTADHQTLDEALKAQKTRFSSPKEMLQTYVRQYLQSNWIDLQAREDIEWGTVQKHEDGNRSISYTYKGRIWDGEMQVFEDTFTFDGEGKYVGVKRTEGYPMSLDNEIEPYETVKNFKMHIKSAAGKVSFYCRANVADSKTLVGKYETPVTLECAQKRLDVTLVSPDLQELSGQLEVDGHKSVSWKGSMAHRIQAGKKVQGASDDPRLQQFQVAIKVREDDRQVGETAFSLYQKKTAFIQLDDYKLEIDAKTEPLGNVLLKMQLHGKAVKGKTRLLASPSIKTKGGKNASLTINADGAAYTVEIVTTEL